MTLAMEERRILVMEDKDFGELAFVRRLSHPCIVRFVALTVAEKVTAIRELIEQRADAMREGALIVVTQRLSTDTSERTCRRGGA